MSKVKSIIFIIVFYFIFFLVKILTFLYWLIQLKKWYPRKKGSLVFVESLPTENAGYQHRAKKWAEILNENNLKAKVITTIPNIKRFNFLIKENVFYFYLYTLLKRTFQLVSLLPYETIIVRREILQYNGYGNLFLEKLLHISHNNIILDFDDDLNLHEISRRKKTFFGKILLENKNKFYDTLRLYNKFMVGSEYLKQLTIQENKQVNPDSILVVPTCVDYNKYEPKKYADTINSITFGWIGTAGNLVYLDIVIKALSKINKKTPIKLIVISSKEYKHKDANFEILNLPWSLENEIKYLYEIDIGLMPLIDSPMEKGKSGFKLIQYMGLGIVSIASAVTINKEIIDDGINGFLVYDYKDWTGVLKKVVDLWPEYSEIGKKAREKINMNYSFNANFEKLIKFLNR